MDQFIIAVVLIGGGSAGPASRAGVNVGHAVAGQVVGEAVAVALAGVTRRNGFPRQSLQCVIGPSCGVGDDGGSIRLQLRVIGLPSRAIVVEGIALTEKRAAAVGDRFAGQAVERVVAVGNQVAVGIELGQLVAGGVVGIARHERSCEGCPVQLLDRDAGQPALQVVAVPSLRVRGVSFGVIACCGIEDVPDRSFGRVRLGQVGKVIVTLDRPARGVGNRRLLIQVVVAVGDGRACIVILLNTVFENVPLSSLSSFQRQLDRCASG